MSYLRRVWTWENCLWKLSLTTVVRAFSTVLVTVLCVVHSMSNKNACHQLSCVHNPDSRRRHFWLQLFFAYWCRTSWSAVWILRTWPNIWRQGPKHPLTSAHWLLGGCFCRSKRKRRLLSLRNTGYTHVLTQQCHVGTQQMTGCYALNNCHTWFSPIQCLPALPLLEETSVPKYTPHLLAGVELILWNTRVKFMRLFCCFFIVMACRRPWLLTT